MEKKDIFSRIKEYLEMYMSDDLRILMGVLKRGAIAGIIIGIILIFFGIHDGLSFIQILGSICLLPVCCLYGAGIALGWERSSRIINAIFGNWVIFGTACFWIIALFIKLILSIALGIIEVPIFIIRVIIDYKKSMPKPDKS